MKRDLGISWDGFSMVERDFGIFFRPLRFLEISLAAGRDCQETLGEANF